jgi:hypothetical protein
METKKSSPQKSNNTDHSSKQTVENNGTQPVPKVRDSEDAKRLTTNSKEEIHKKVNVGHDKLTTDINSEGYYFEKDSSYDGKVRYYKYDINSGIRDEISKSKFERQWQKYMN